MLKLKKIFGLGLIAALSMCMMSCDEDDDTIWIRFAWPTIEQDHIQYIFADRKNINDWYTYIWDDVVNIDDEDFVFRDIKVLNDRTPGMRGLPEIFKLGEANSTTKHKNNGEYFKAIPGSYIAVCSVEDPLYDVIWEIIADYTIYSNPNWSKQQPDNDESLLEIGFNLTKFLDGDDDLGWYGFEPGMLENPRLSKKKGMKRFHTDKITSTNGTMDLTFYVIGRPKTK